LGKVIEGRRDSPSGVRDRSQFVPFVEAGRVTDEAWDLGDLHEDMQWTAGVGVRFRLKRMVARVDVAASDESTGVKVMVNQPF
jgi:hypothetical protein